MMHMRGNPQDMQKNTFYNNLVDDIYTYFQEALKRGEQAGIEAEQIVIDPGIGFGKAPEDNYKLISHLPAFIPLGRPLLVGPSRKSFLSLAGMNKPEERLEGTLAACTVAVLAGVDILRVHDIGPVRRAVAAAAQFKQALYE